MMKNPCDTTHRKNARDVQQRVFILVIADRGIVSHAKVFLAKAEAENALIAYLRDYEAYKGPNDITAVWRWLGEHDERLSVEIVEQSDFHAQVKAQEALRRIHDALYLDLNEHGPFYNPDKSWSPDTLDAIAEVVRPLFHQPPGSAARDDPDDPEELTPKDRAEFVRRIEQVSPYEEGLDAQDNMVCPSEFITDLLTDIRHYCDVKDVDFHACDRSAYNHYLKEREHGKEAPNG